MKRLDSLIRLHRWQLDEKRRQLVDLETMSDETKQRIGDLRQQLTVEGRVLDDAWTGSAGAPVSGPSNWHAFAGNVRDRREKLEVTLDTIEAQKESLNDEIAAAFQELKKFELIAESRLRQARQLAARREQFSLDEMALSAFRRSSVR